MSVFSSESYCSEKKFFFRSFLCKKQFLLVFAIAFFASVADAQTIPAVYYVRSPKFCLCSDDADLFFFSFLFFDKTELLLYQSSGRRTRSSRDGKWRKRIDFGFAFDKTNKKKKKKKKIRSMRTVEIVRFCTTDSILLCATRLRLMEHTFTSCKVPVFFVSLFCFF